MRRSAFRKGRAGRLTCSAAAGARAASAPRMTRPDTRPSLRTELLVNFALLAVAALVFAVGAVLLVYDQANPARGALTISALVAADVLVLTAFGAYQINRLLVRPLRETAAAAEAIAAGDL